MKSVNLFPKHLKPPTLSSKVKIINREETGGRCAVAKENICKGEILCYDDASKIDKPIKYSWQIAENVHSIGPGILDHICEGPTCVINEKNEFVASRDIKEGEYLTFNYLTTEYDMSVGFRCICGSANCFGYIKGFGYLDDKDKKTIVDNFGISSYLKSKHAEENK